jgi:hypothetical protein
MTNYSRAGCLLLVGLIGFATWGCGSQQIPAKRPESPPAKWEDFQDRLARPLFDLVTAPQPDKFTESSPYELIVKDGFVVIVIEAAGPEWTGDLGWAVEALGGKVEVSIDSTIQANVPISAVLALAKHPRSNFVRLPIKPERGGR